MASPLITPQDLRIRLSATTILAIFDDDNTRDLDLVLASDAVLQVLNEAHARCVSWLPSIYTKIPDGSDTSDTPELLRAAELAYAKAIAWERHREYARASGVDVENLFKRADDMMARIQASVLRITDSPPERAPANVGGFVRNNGPRVFCSDPSGRSNSGDF